jgi:lysozyme
MALKPRHKAAAGLTAATLACSAALISHWEGEDRVAKHNSFDPKGVITVCDGYTNLDDPSLKVGMRFTHEECQKLLMEVIPEYAYPIDQCLIHFREYGPHKQAALISFAYNLGPGKICGEPVGTLLNRGRDREACNYMTHYERAVGRVLPGLVNRREDGFWGEVAWCLRTD